MIFISREGLKEYTQIEIEELMMGFFFRVRSKLQHNFVIDDSKYPF